MTTRMEIEVISFGYKYRRRYRNEVDCRELRNPYFNPELKSLNGLDSRVRDYVLESKGVNELYTAADNMLSAVVPTVAFGCVGGKHRSVVLAEDYAQRMRDKGHNVIVRHTALED